ncbi:hypothetical protein L873DRAFT_1467218 [Choiromyces venosus 120613-1]|uniref:Uncharacterized protein n=1 Tax=Choiromyces venosus 120613-1 TaxID=1336337 RepID=A0A3N4JB60_9PEZI|nr:hypothetical protein L873DRAFT_1467218 [Choiromyces venosus 120613-1]
MAHIKNGISPLNMVFLPSEKYKNMEVCLAYREIYHFFIWNSIFLYDTFCFVLFCFVGVLESLGLNEEV